MKAIELTKEQKEKLLEMCKALFPTFNWSDELYGSKQYVHFYSKEEGIPIITGGFLYEGNSYQVDECIHWFEFCMTQLATALMCKNKKHMQQLFMGLKHPVDYLYEQFKKLPTKDDRIEKIVFQKIEQVIGKAYKKERTLNSKLLELGLDDLDQIELIMYIEQTLDISIDDNDVETKIFKKGNTIQHLVDYVKSKL